jgi:hypothetical protein
MRSSFRWLVVVGVLFVVAAGLAGSRRSAVSVRRTLAPALQGRVWAYVALAAVGLLLVATGRVSDFARFLVVALLLGLGALWIELTRSQTLVEFPDARAPALLDDTRDRIESWWKERQGPAEAPAAGAAPATGDVTARLAGLADLHARGELTDEEYAAAKARVLTC